MRETCVKCGMVANVDPSLHHERYGHRPEVIRNGRLYRFSYYGYRFQPVRGAA